MQVTHRQEQAMTLLFGERKKADHHPDRADADLPQ
jgi:hypothetical protein